jgi:hypothetical protein
MTDPIIGRVRFVNGVERDVYRAPDGRQYVIGYNGEPVYGRLAVDGGRGGGGAGHRTSPAGVIGGQRGQSHLDVGPGDAGTRPCAICGFCLGSRGTEHLLQPPCRVPPLLPSDRPCRGES